jgi:hypothetical protein
MLGCNCNQMTSDVLFRTTESRSERFRIHSFRPYQEIKCPTPPLAEKN